MQEKEVLIAIIASVLLFIISTIVIVLFLFRHLKKKHQHKEMILFNEKKFQAELLKTEIEIQEQTRRNLASDLHDNIGQILSLTSVIVGSINLENKENATKKITEIKTLLTKSISELRQLSKIIHGEQLIRQGLLSTIEQEIAWLERNGFYSVKLTHNLASLESSNAEKDLFLYRLLQESLNNIIKHSGADKISLHLSYSDLFMHVSISDNGTGFKVEEKMNEDHGLGLRSMKKRIDLLNGSMDIDSIIDRGTTINLKIPYP